jgi:hypothetical protein
MSSMPGIDSPMSLLSLLCLQVALMVPLLLTAIVRTLTRAQATLSDSPLSHQSKFPRGGFFQS